MRKGCSWILLHNLLVVYLAKDKLGHQNPRSSVSRCTSSSSVMLRCRVTSTPCSGTPLVVYLAKEERGHQNPQLFCHEMYGTLVD